MKLKFNKTEDGDIAAVILDNTKQEAFSYIKMIAALLDGQPIECEYGEGITPEEQEQIRRNALLHFLICKCLFNYLFLLRILVCFTIREA